MTKIDDREFAKRIRQNILEILNLWASKEKQLEYQENVPVAQVTVELFSQWSDDFYHPESTHFKMVFNEKEREALAAFDKVINHISDKTPNDLPVITDFVKTNKWLIVNQEAIRTLNKI